MKRIRIMKWIAVLSGLAVSPALFVKKLREKDGAELLHEPVG